MKDEMITLTVDKNGNGDFQTINETVKHLAALNCKASRIFVRNGVYHEKINIDIPGVSLIGEDSEKTVLSFEDHAENDLGTFVSYTAFLGGSDFKAENICFSNPAGRKGQALAAYIECDRSVFSHCRFVGFQDTIFTGPMPFEPQYAETYFRGPRPVVKEKLTRLYFHDCYISGDVDFIFGSATAFFENCEICSEDRHANDVNGYITAASTPKDQKYGYVFYNCRLTGSLAPHTVYLGRPWRKYAKTAFINCWMGQHIKPEGWYNWDNPEAETTTQYEEYGSTGPGACPEKRVAWAKQLRPSELQQYSAGNVLSGSDGWNPLNL